MKTIGAHKAIVNYLKPVFAKVMRPGANIANPKYPYAVVQYEGEEPSIDNNAGGYDIFTVWCYGEPGKVDDIELTTRQAVAILDGADFANDDGGILYITVEKGSMIEGVLENREPFLRFTVIIAKKFF